MHIPSAKATFQESRRILLPRIGVRVFNFTGSSEYNYLWFRIAKNGTRSVLAYLDEYAPPDFHKTFVPFLRQQHSRKFKFCIIRNPWNRLVSCYRNKVLTKQMFRQCWDKDFEFFVEFATHQSLKCCDRHLQLQTNLFPIRDVDLIGKVETLAQDWETICTSIGIRHDPLERENSTHDVHYARYYTERTKQMIRKAYAPDVEIGEYEFEAN